MTNNRRDIIFSAQAKCNVGNIKWYKQGTATAISTSKTLTVNASDVKNVQAYTCQLEG